MSEHKPWEPTLDTEPQANPFANRIQGEGRFVDEIREPEKDTAPLQGSKDLSDEDSLVDVAARDTRKEAQIVSADPEELGK